MRLGDAKPDLNMAAGSSAQAVHLLGFPSRLYRNPY